MVVDGSLAGMVASNLRIDTGADCTVVRQDYIPEIAYTGNHINLVSWRGSQPSSHKLARITIKVGSAEALCEVAVAESLDCPALLGADLGEQLTVALMQHVIKKSTSKVEPPIQASPSSTQPSVSVGGGQTEVLETAPVGGTRAATAREQRRDEDDEFASAQSQCHPRELVDVIDFPRVLL